MGEWKQNAPYQEGDIVHFDGKDWEFRDGKFRGIADDVHPFVRKFYDVLWWLLKALLVLAFLTAIFYGRYLFDKWYINWIMDK